MAKKKYDMINFNRTLVKRKKIVISVVVILILVVIFSYSFVVYMNDKKNKTYTRMEREMYMAAKKYVNEVHPFDNSATVSLDVDANELLEANYLGSMRDPSDKNNVCTGSINITKKSTDEFEYIVLLNCGDYKNNGVKYNDDGKILNPKVYIENIYNNSVNNNTGNTNTSDNTNSNVNTGNTSSNTNTSTSGNTNSNTSTGNTNSNNTSTGNSNTSGSTNNNQNTTPSTGGSTNTNPGSNIGNNGSSKIDNSNTIGKIDASGTVIEQPITSGSMVNGRIIKIVDRSNGNCAQAIEYYYSDSKYKYYFNCILSPSIFVIIDGKEYNLKVALNTGVVSMAELEKAGFRPMKKPNDVVDR